ncbi:hypothetical protein AQUCO_02700171v1 [Aquilegia coerulea]|uniref:Uncharacterized protein n=2 Tax=Aquilegia coerulea TaxID=218851 RepID=A0A2G5D5J6_AQUCA|nr:hypothetical protein AQUCO_02700171v1 [Aquilegia coerulea]
MGDNEEQRKIMLGGRNEDRKWREKMLEQDQCLWTVECLRGRLLAERVASKAGKQDAEFIQNKLLELEQKLRLEIKAKDKAEKKLKFLMGKLESLKVSHLQNHSSSVHSEVSSCSSTASSGISTVGEQIPNSQIKNLVKCKSDGDMSVATYSSVTSDDLRSTNSGTSDIGNPGSRTPSVSSWVSANHSCEAEGDTNSKDSNKCENRTSANNNGEKNKAEAYVDNPLPFPGVLWPTSKNQINKDTAHDALVALRHVREQLQNPLRKGNGNRSHSIVFCTGA